ncbi:flagellar motor protein [Thauera sinica]|uniref:Flagellar motor protein n=1 Tax=Thauera sinica TaxID=2665146 RepID=A0ABW1ANU0_9RHOO|nr:flagellar motor protein [Thauera sp. K11]ATE59396.1 flagellar motor protein [Thauera sp. K11]
MDSISLVGVTLGLAAILVGQSLEGGHISSLLQPTAFMIVVGGTLGAVMLQSPLRTFVEGVRMVRWVFVPPAVSHEEIITQVSGWSQIARKEGLLVLENRATAVGDPFMRKGLQLLVDGVEPGRLREVLEVEIGVWEAQMRQAARIWEGAGGYAPTIGILGAVMGLIHVMENLTDPSKLGSGIAVAFVATIYGVGLANLVFLPISKKLMSHISTLATMREMFVDGIVGIANGDNPRIVESRMRGYVA